MATERKERPAMITTATINVMLIFLIGVFLGAATSAWHYGREVGKLARECDEISQRIQQELLQPTAELNGQPRSDSLTKREESK